MVRLRWVFTASITRDTRIQNQLGKEDSFICGNTKTAHGKSRGSSATITTPRPSKGPAAGRGQNFVFLRGSFKMQTLERHLLYSADGSRRGNFSSHRVPA